MPYSDNIRQAEQQSERVIRKVEEEVARLPSDAFFWAACGAMAAAAVFQLAGRKHASLFVGQWVAPLMLLAIHRPSRA